MFRYAALLTTLLATACAAAPDRTELGSSARVHTGPCQRGSPAVQARWNVDLHGLPEVALKQRCTREVSEQTVERWSEHPYSKERAAIGALLSIGGSALLLYGLADNLATAAGNVASEHTVGSDPSQALRRLDAVDGVCDCARFTEGDEPPEYSTERLLVDRLRAAGSDLPHARGPILRALTR
jgi:hypothetical protein